MDIQAAIRRITERQHLSEQEMAEVLHTIMSGQASSAQIAGLLVALRMKGETVAEITGAVKVMRQLVTPVLVQHAHLVDTCGTGGDGLHTFNISTASAFVVAAAGGKVAKHGNRSVSSQCGSADVLQAAGVNIQLTPEQVARCILEVGVGFMFAPLHHKAMQHVAAIRREMGIRTLFNLLGPLTNPAGATHQVIGVFSKAWLETIAQVLKCLGSEHVLVVHSKDGLDEISLAAETDIVELKQDVISHYSITPEQFGIKRQPLDSLKVTNAQESLALLKTALSKQASAARDIVLLNAGAAIYAADLCSNLQQGVEMARDAISSGLAKEKLEELINFTAVYSVN